MKVYSCTAITLALFSLSLFPISTKKTGHPVSTSDNTKPLATKIQVAILLDVSNSMDGLIEQAKAQLWNMVSVLGKATCDNIAPQIEIALYEYGRTTNNANEGYVQQLSGFTTDLDKLSQSLFKLKTNGGDEYCGHVLYNSLTSLKWDTASTNYKVIFIAGNEDFLQGNITYTKACAEASKKNVIINTIYCGDKSQGIKEHWNLAGECGKGSFTNINQDASMEDLDTPYDSVLFSLNEQLNNTYIAYGSSGSIRFIQQGEVDKMNYTMNKSVAAKRVAVKSKKQLYKNTGWDLVDAFDQDSLFVATVDMKTLPDSLQRKSRSELKYFVKEKNTLRGNIQKEIASISSKRERHIAMEKAKPATNTTVATMEFEIERIIKQQAKRFNMIIQ